MLVNICPNVTVVTYLIKMQIGLKNARKYVGIEQNVDLIQGNW